MSRVSSDAASSTAAPSSTAAISLRGLRKIYQTHFWSKRYTALHGLDLDVEPGTIFGFVGPNGAGKTTTIKILVGLHAANQGTAKIFGRDYRDPEARAQVGFLPERPYFYQHLSARELLHFYGQLSGVEGAARKTRVELLLERVDLVRFADVPLGQYSKGMLQRVGLAQALIGDPALIILDEPMSGLDPLGRALVRDIILEERQSGRTVFFSSHILHDVETLCDQVAVLVGGELRGVGSVSELLGGHSRYVEVRVAGLSADALPVPPTRVDRDEALLRVQPDQVDATLDAVRAAGGRVLEVHRVRGTLEDVFLDEVERAKPVDAKKLGVLA
jgi:ABC-2 type transport system ATP-binding protein